MTKLRAVDLFCGGGGAGMGLSLAGFDVVGVDIEDQPDYPFTFIKADALEFPLDGFDFIWASPPCQAFTKARNLQGNNHPDYIDVTRQRMIRSGLPYVIENVPGAPLIDPIELCGTMFGLELYRHRLFECSFQVVAPAHPIHTAPQCKMGRPPRPGEFIQPVGHFSGVSIAQKAMEISWLGQDKLREAIPPAYSKFIGLVAYQICTLTPKESHMARKPKKDPKAAADAAEARSKKAPKAKTTKAAQAGPAVQAAKTNPDVDTEAKALFLHHLPKIEAGKKKIADATNALRILYKSAKADGMLKCDFDVAIEMQGAEGEKKKKAAIARELTIARWLGYDLGAQLDMFLEPERVPATERAYSEGQTASMSGKPLKCDYHETTPQYHEFCRGFQDHQVTLQAGFKKLEKDDDYGTGLAGAPKKPGNVVAMTRSEMQAQQAEGHKVN